MKHKLIEKIIELVGSYNAPYEEYYTHENGDMWKWNYPLTKYAEHKIPLCMVGEDSDKSYEIALKMIIEELERMDKKGTLVIDMVRPIRSTMQSTIKTFFDNLYVTDISIALDAYRHLSSGKYTIDEVLNMTCSKLIEDNIKVSMSRQNTFDLPF